MGVTGRAETRLSAWIGRQTNASSRLVEAVRTGSDIAVVHGAIRWQGELESWGRHLLQAANQEGRNLSPEDIQAVRDLYRLWDRQGAFAVAIGMRLRPNGRLDPAIRQVVEQPGAADIWLISVVLTVCLAKKCRWGLWGLMVASRGRVESSPAPG